MKRLLVLAGLVAAVGLTIAVVTGGASTAPGQTIHVIEHANTDATADVDPPGDSAGDVLTFHNPVFNAADSKRMGRDQGYCIRIKAPGSYECNWTTFLEDGHHTRHPHEWRDDAFDLLARREERDFVRASIDQLPESYRTVLLLRDIEELETAEVARVLGVSENLVKVRLHRARQALRALLEPRFEKAHA